MDQASITHNLLIQLEGYLDHPLSLDNVAAKVGYSKWHLQRMLRDVTGHAIGAYTHTRCLSKSVVALCLTARPIPDTALRYRFDSQQTSTCALKKQFVQAPALYRHSPEWSTSGIHPPLHLGEFAVPKHKFVILEDTPLVGIAQSYFCSLEQTFDFHHEMRYQFWHDFLGSSPTIPPIFYGSNGTRPSQDRDDKREVFYTTMLARDQADGYVLTGYPVTLQDGEYMVFIYKDPGTSMQGFILTVYGMYVSMLNLTRHRGQDIERYCPTEDAEMGDRPTNLRCKLLIPIRR